MAPNETQLTLVRGEPVDYPEQLQTADGPVTIFDPGFVLHWRVEDEA